MKHRQSGFSAVLMLAVIVVVGSLLAFTISLGSSTQAALAHDIAAQRVHQAAQAGLEWARYRIRVPATPNCQAVRHFNVQLGGNVRVTVTCAITGTHRVGSATLSTYALSATACTPPAGGACPNTAGAPNYVEAVATGIEER